MQIATEDSGLSYGRDLTGSAGAIAPEPIGCIFVLAGAGLTPNFPPQLAALV